VHTTEPRSEIGLGRQIILHLVPGVLLALAYTALGAVFRRNGLPPILGFYAASLLILFPVEIGVPMLLERKGNSPARFKDVFPFRESPSAWQMALLILGSLLWAGLVFVIAGTALVDPIKEAFFSWVPEWYDLGYYLQSQEYARPVRIATWALGIVFAVIVGPIVEEFYFRSYLLPRMRGLKGWAPLVGSILFALYHLWSPWLFVVRLVALLPMVYAVWWKRSVWIGIGAHCLLNLVGDALSTTPLVFG
jgi:hypothetical protein